MNRDEGKKKNWFLRHKILTLVAVIVVIAIAATASSGNKGATGNQKSASQTKAKLTLDDGWQLSTPDAVGAQYVDGYVSNNTSSAIDNYVQITFNEYDTRGANIGTCLANTNTIDANGKWKFHALCDIGKNIATVKFKELTGF